MSTPSVKAPRRASLAVALVCTLSAAGPAVASPGECQEPEIRTDPNSCKELFEGFGLPVSNKDEAAGDFTFVCRDKFLLRHNNTTKTPDWVMERLTEESVRKVHGRPSQSFNTEKCVPSNNRAGNKDYTWSLYARGHQAASADFSVNEAWMRNTFVYSNAVPQEGDGFNSSIWSQFEAMVQDLAASRGEIYVITGPVYQDPEGDDITVPEGQNPCEREIVLPALERKEICGGSREDGPVPTCEDGVAIPAGLFKIIVDPDNDRVNAYLLPNIDHRDAEERGTSSEEYLATFRVSVLNLEDRTGYTFLPELTRHERRVMTETCTGTMFR